MKTRSVSDVEAPSVPVYVSEYAYHEVFASLPAYERIWRGFIRSLQCGGIATVYSLISAVRMDGIVFIPGRRGDDILLPLPNALVYIAIGMLIGIAFGYAFPFMKTWWGLFVVGIVICLPFATYLTFQHRVSLADSWFVAAALVVCGGIVGVVGKAVMLKAMRWEAVSCPIDR